MSAVRLTVLVINITPRIAPNQRWQRHNTGQLTSNAVILNAGQRECVEKAIRETCEFRQWNLQAVNVRTSHVHTVVVIGVKKPEIALNAFKSNSTRQMRENECWKSDKSPWADKGSNRFLWNERSVGLAIDYVINGQGDELPDFD